MKHFWKRALSCALALLMLLQVCPGGVVFAANRADKAFNPAEQIPLTVPERFQDGGNWFFIPESSYAASEKSTEKIYIPIQRTGNLETEADVVLKVTDISAKHDVNYTVEIYKEDVDPAVLFDDMSLVDLIQNADGQEEYEPVADENEFGELVNAAGGAQIVDEDGNVLGTVTATPLDENGNPIADSGDEDAGAVTPGAVEEADWTTGKTSGTADLRAGRNAFTGTVSDRQELEGGDLYDFNAAAMGGMTNEEFDKEMADAAQENYPGKEYTLHFSAGEEAKFLVITPLYSEAAEGDAQLMLMLKSPSEPYEIGEDVNPVSVTIYDMDEPEAVTVSMAAETVYAENGKASISVTREGRINAIKGVRFSSWDGSAAEGDEYSGIGAKLYFPVGITSRTVEIPVYHGETEKDFYVSITALDDESIEVATTHVIIPAAEADSDGELMGVTSVNGHGLTDPINLKGGWFEGGTGNGFDSDTAFHLSTNVDKEETSHFWLPTSGYGYAYDGLYLEYDAFMDWCDGEFRLVRWTGSNANRVHVNAFDDGGVTYDHWLYSAWGTPQASEKYTVEAANVDNEGPAWSDSSVTMWVRNVRLIKRQFTIQVDDPEIKPLLGVSDEDVLRDYEAVFLDGKQQRTRTLWTGDAFAVSVKNEKGPLRLVGLEVKTTDGKWVRIVTIDGKSQLANLTMSADTINALAAKNALAWSANGNCDHGGSFYKGTLTVRPVFDYNYTTVELQQDVSGILSMTAPEPSILWDFNNNNDMMSKMGTQWSSKVEYSAGQSGSDEYYTFTAKNADPYVSVETPAASADNVRWVKIRAKNLSSAGTMELFASIGNSGRNIGSTNVKIPISTDRQWHEYVAQMPASWTGTVAWMRLDPLAGCENGDQIQIDYVAFFPDELSARAFRSGSETVNTAGTYTYHLGDQITFQTSITEQGNWNNLKADGVSYELRKYSETGVMPDWIDVHYINGSTTVMLSGRTIGDAIVDNPHYTVKPTFTEKGNSVTVEVPKAALAYLDTEKGLFQNYVSRFESGDSWVYTLQENILSNIPMELTVFEKTPGTVMPCWTVRSSTQSWGYSVAFRTGERTASNRVKLQLFNISAGSLPDIPELPSNLSPTYVSVTGTVATSTYNLSTERSSTDLLPAKSAYVSFGDTATWTDEDGKFELPAVYAMGGTRLTYTVTYNGSISIQTVIVPPASSPKSEKLTMDMQSVEAVTAGADVVKMESFSATGAHFVSAYAEQDNILIGTVNGLIMNGLTMTVEVQVAQGRDYLLNGETYSEHVKDVTLYFQDQVTGEIHGLFSSNTQPSQNSPAQWSYNEETGVFTLRINQFDPAHPTEWTYGDVLMAQLTTDKKTGLSAFDESVDMVYEPVSTGIAVYADPDYEPQTFDYDLDNIAELLGITPQTDEDGNLLDDDTRYSFGSFPYIGEITAAIHVFSRVASSATVSAEMDALMADLGDMADDGEDYFEGGNTGGETKNYTLSVLIKMDETVWGGVRFMFGVIISGGGGNGYKRQRNPYQNVNSLIAMQMNTDQRNAVIDANDENNFVTVPKKRSTPLGRKQDLQSNFGGPRFTFSAFVGFYLDYGYVEISTDNGAEKSHDMVFMGAGGFLGFGGALGYTWAFMAGPVPMYINVEAGLNVTFFIGSEGNPQKTLQSFKTDKELHGQDFQFNFEFKGRVYVAGTIGVGIYKIAGVRVTAEVAFEAGYSNNITDWYPNLFDTGWGYVTEATFTGTMDLIVTSIDFYSATWPLPLADGFLYYFQETKRANKCISYVEDGIQKGEGSASARATAQSMCDELKLLVDANELLAAAGADAKPQLADVETIKTKTYALKDYAYDNDIINWTTKNTIEMNKQGGIIGSIINATTEDSEEDGLRFHTNNHVHPEWVANDGSLMAAFGNASSQALVEDAYAQPSSKILSIGDGRYLLVFLGDTASRDRMAASTLTWTIYDENTDQWTEPQTVAGDHIADSRPNLTDADDKVILSWAGIPEQKYNDLKAAFKAELTEAVGTEPTDEMIREAMEADPARVMSAYEIYSVEFDKTSASFADPVRLTDDDYYDDYPQAVYDALTGDYIVMYYKTAQDDESYDNAGDKLQDLVSASPDPEKTYSVICYMIYNAAADENGGQKDDSGELYTVPAGWVTDYLYEGELNAESLAAYGGTAYYLSVWHGQRFMPSTIRNENGTYADPPITDLTVAPGRNGIATFAFTVDKDFNLNTAEDRELYVEFYNFETHKPYVPVRVGGTVTEEKEYYVAAADQFVTLKTEKQVEVGTPRLIRNGGDTYLFWREDGVNLKYLNITQILNARVAAVSNPSDSESDWTYAVKNDGTFATDVVTGLPYEPRTQKVELASLMTDDAIEITDYEVITDADDNLYVVWTDTVTSSYTNEIGETYPVTAQEIFASAMIRQEEQTYTGTNENGASITDTTQTVRWSKPYRLTRDNGFNDGLALALDSDGGLIIVHNQYTKQTAQSEEEVYALIEQGKIGVTQDQDGNLYAASLSYNSPVSLMVTRLDKVGSLEATAFDFSDDYPVAGQTVAVYAAIENVGLTNAEGSQIDFYESKNGVRGEKIVSFTSDETIQVNTARQVAFYWTIPEDGPEGYSIEAVIREKQADGSYYDAISSFSDAFVAAPIYATNGTEVTQEGDQFRVKFSASNAGNVDAEEGTTVSVRLVGLYGDLNSDRYGHVENDVLYSEDISSRLSAKTLREKTDMDTVAIPQSTVYEGNVLVDIPASVFRYCGYDAIQIVLTDKAGNVLAESGQMFVTMGTPMNLSLNDGNAVSISSGDTQQVSLDYDDTVFMDKGTVVYSVDDPTIAVVDDEGNITGLAEGTTALTATILPSGRTVSIQVNVDGGRENPFTDVEEGKFYYEPVLWAYYHDPQITAGTSATTFSPNDTCTRAQVVTFLWRAAGAPEPETTENPFEDVKEGKYYYKAVLWAAETGVTSGTGKTTFSPDDGCTRAQVVTFLWRFAGSPEPTASTSPFEDVSDGKYYTKAVLWAAETGVTAGTSETTFRPNDTCTRGQIVTFLWGYMSE